jgi:dihydropyrimidinase
VIWNEDSPVTVTNTMLHHACDYTPYEGMELAAWPATTLCRGRAVYRDGALCGEAGYGAFQACERPLAARVPPPSRIPELMP